MSINLDNIKEIFHNNKEVKKIEDSNGNILWQKPSASITISYACLREKSYLPADKTVTLSGGSYSLTSADLPSINLGSTSDQIVGWTLDGSTQLQAGDTVSTNVTLKAIHRYTVTKTYSWTEGKNAPISKGSTATISCSHSTTLYGLHTLSSGTYTCSYSKSLKANDTRMYGTVGIRGFNGQIATIQVYSNTQFKIHWNPAVRSVTYSKNPDWETADKFYADTYPMILVIDGNTWTKLYTNANVAANTVTSTISASRSSNAYIIFQYGGWDTSGARKTSWGKQYAISYLNLTYYPNSNHSGNETDYLYLYMQ